MPWAKLIKKMSCLLVPLFLSAQAPSRILYPQQTAGFGYGWAVDSQGKLGMNIPAATVPGEIPIPVIFRFNATFGQGLETYTQDLEKIVNHQIIDYTKTSTGTFDRDIFATIHFGGIFFQPGWDISQASLTPATPTYLVLEDGSEFGAVDFSQTVVPDPSLLASFGFSGLASVSVTGTGTLAMTSATSANFGSSVQALLTPAPAWFNSNPDYPQDYIVLMSRDRARIFAFNPNLDCWVPVLWLDRFGHDVRFQWNTVNSTVPTVTKVTTVVAVNQAGKGVQVQWVSASTMANQYAAAMPLLRVDYIGMLAPSMQVAGIAGIATVEPQALGGGSPVLGCLEPQTAGAVLRPTQVALGNPSDATYLPMPAWAVLGQPAATGESTPFPATLTWSYTYDATNAEVNTLTDAMGVLTTFTWQTNSIYAPAYSGNCNMVRSVVEAQSSDALTSTKLDQQWVWHLPANYTDTWTRSLTRTWSGSSIQPAGVTPTVDWTFLGPGDPNYGNGVAQTVAVMDAPTGGNTLKSTTNTWIMAGLDKTIPAKQDSTTTVTNGPTLSMSSILDTYGNPTSTTVSSGSYSSETTGYTYENHPTLLDPDRLTQKTYARTVQAQASNAPTQNITYNSPTLTANGQKNWLPSSTYAADGGATNQMGQTVDYDAGGHLHTASNFASGPLFGAADQASRTYTVDPSSGLPTKQVVSYNDPTTNTGSLTSTWDAYDSAGRCLQATDGAGIVTQWHYDARGRIWFTSVGGQASITYTYPDERTQIITQNGRQTTVHLDGFGRVTQRVRGNDGVAEANTYDSNGNLIQVVETTAIDTNHSTSQSRTTSKTFDALGRLTSLTPPVGPPMTSCVYSADGNGNQVIKANYQPPPPVAPCSTVIPAFSTSQTLDQWGQVVSSVGVPSDPSNALGTSLTTQNWFDAMGHVLGVSVTSPADSNASENRSFVYNALGFLSTRTEPETGTTTFGPTYDSLGLPQTITEATGRARTLTYDGLGRLRSKASTTTSDSTTFTWSGLTPTQATSTSGGQTTLVIYGVDPFNRINSETVTPPSGSGWSQGYAYDPAGRLSAITYPDQRVVTYQYDDAGNYGRVTGVLTRQNSSAPQVTVATVGANGQNAYDGWGNLQILQFASGSQDAWYYQTNGLLLSGQLMSPVGTSIPLRSYSYDPLNHLVEAGEWALNHDALGRLTSATLSTTSGVPLPAGCSVQSTLGYDGFGNNLQSSWNGAGSTNLVIFQTPFPNANYPPANTNEMSSVAINGAVTGWTYAGVNTGEPETVGTGIGASAPQIALTWDGLGRLTAAGTTSYAYYPTGLRISRSDSSNSQLNQSYAYTSGGKLLSAWVQPPTGQSGTMVKTASLKTSGLSASPLLVVGDQCDAEIMAPATGATVQTGQSVSFTGTTDIGTAALWTFGDGGSGSGFSTTHAYATAGTYTVRLKVTGPPGVSADTATISLNVIPAVTIGTFSTSASTIPNGNSVTLTWSTTGATTVTLNGNAVAASGSQTFNPASTTTYTLKASNAVTSVTSVQTVTVVQKPVISSFSPAAGTVLAGAQAVLNWSVSGANSLTISPSIGTVSGSSYAWTTSVPGTSPVTTTYTLTATDTVNGVSVSQTAQASVTVEPDPTVPSIAFSASPTTIGGGQATTLSWNITTAVGSVTASISGGRFGSGTSIAASGSATDTPSSSTTYVITAYSTEMGAQAQGTASVAVTVLYPAVPVVTLSSSPTAIQPGKSTTLSWNVTNAQGGTLAGTLSGPGGSQSVTMPSGSLSVSPGSTCQYTLAVTNTLLGNQASASASASVQVTPLPVINAFSASSMSVTSGASVLLSWNVSGATSVCVNGAPQAGSSLSVTPTASANTYTLTATNAMGSATPQTLTINVTNWMGDVVYLGNVAIAEITPTGVHELHCDHLGTPILITNGTTGAVESQQYFGPYGEQLLAPTGYVPMTGYTGHFQTEPNGFIYMRGRFYSPTWHRFLNSDQGADQFSLNQFAYCGGSPMMRTDPTGMMMVLSENGRAMGSGWWGDYYNGIEGVDADSAGASSDPMKVMYGDDYRDPEQEVCSTVNFDMSGYGDLAQTGQGPQIAGYIADAGNPAFLMASMLANCLSTTVRNPDGSTTYIDDSNEPDQPFQGKANGSAEVDVSAAMPPGSPLILTPSQPNSMLNRFLDGYQHAGNGAKAMAIGNAIGNIPNVNKVFTLMENGVGAVQAANAGFTSAASIMGTAAAWATFTEFALTGFALNGAQQIGMIVAGATNMYYDAY